MTSRYFKICPRGFANEVRYIRVETAEQAAQIEAEYADYSDKNPDGHAGWTNDARAELPGVAVAVEDRNWL